VARLARRAAICAGLLVSATMLTGCGFGAGVTDARQACGYVNHALKLEKLALGATGAAKVRLESNAMATLIRATPFAARATSADGQWNALQTTIGEAQRVPISDLAPSLRRICKVANSASPYL
jgi:hypothetical protein